MAISLSDHLLLYKGAVNTGVIREGEEALIIDIGDGKVLETLGLYGIRRVNGLLFTHHHRDQAYGAYRALGEGTWVGVPKAERGLFEDVYSRYWQDPTRRWHMYYFRPNLVLAEPLPVHREFVDGETFQWGPARITALSTPGHTDGSMSFLVEVDGRRIAFCGDLIYGKGKVLELYSLQKGFGHLTDYHGFMFAWREAMDSLKRLLDKGAELLIPSHGEAILEPKEAIELLGNRLNRCYENYLSTSALWHYFPELLSNQTSSVAPISAPMYPAPSFVRHIGTSWMLLSESGNAFLMDCGSEDVIKNIGDWLASGDINGVEGLWITHIHDDHTDAIPKFRQRFGCEVIAERSVAQVVVKPSAWKLPCLSPNAVPIDRLVEDKESWRWREFALTAYHFPGQTLYHGGLLVEGRGLRLFFCGDSFTPSGLDDYCAYNRNFLGEGKGYDLCLRLMEELQPDLVFNSHVDRPFVLEPDILRTWRMRLAERRKLLEELLPWEDPNYGIDPYWAFCYPYEQEVSRGRIARVEIVIVNHSSRPAICSATLVFPRSWKGQGQTPRTECEIEPGMESRLLSAFQVPPHISPGRYVVLVDITRNGLQFPVFAEFLVEVR
jgi:glyoxylase-like metal-dependent hydrolase (beta-lactamase superfamily II)